MLELSNQANGVALDRRYSVSDAACGSHVRGYKVRSHGPEDARL